ncbi:MAG: hypothetical protein WCJ59_00530 [bacterium]
MDFDKNSGDSLTGQGFTIKTVWDDDAPQAAINGARNIFLFVMFSSVVGKIYTKGITNTRLRQSIKMKL